MTRLAPDRGEIERFFTSLFRYAKRDRYVALRAFNGDKPWRRDLWRGIPAGDQAPLLAAACRLAEAAANASEPVVFCPPVATFKGRERAREEDLADGIALSVECDAAPAAARVKLETLLGPPTVVVASGGEWIDPESGEIEDRLHLHWRLMVPTGDADSHADLKEARRLAQRIAAADGTAVPPVHPLRWPGSWHTKAEPRLAQIVSIRDSEIDLAAALTALRAVMRMSPDETRGRIPGEPQAPIEQVAGWLRTIPNDDLPWAEWNRVGLAAFAATGGSEEGHNAWAEWSKKSSKDVQEQTRARWEHFRKFPPDRIGAGALAYMADGAWSDLDLAETPGWDDLHTLLSGNASGAATPSELNGHAATLAAPGAAGSAKQAAAKPNAHDAKPWPPIIDITTTAGKVPPFPTYLLPPPFRAFVADVSDRMQVPPDFVAIPLLIEAATMIGREFRLAPKRHDDWSERACLWGAVVAPPGLAKSPAVEEALRPIRKMQREAYDRFLDEHKAWEKGDQEAGLEPQFEALIANETTVEALTRLMVHNPRGILLYRDELSGWFSSMNKYRARGGDDRQFFLECWAGGAYRVDRVNKPPVYVDDLYLSIFGTLQPETMRKVFHGGDMDGMTARFGLLVFPDLPKSVAVVDRRPDLEIRTAVEQRLRDMRAASANNPFDSVDPILRFSGEAYALFNRWMLANVNRSERRDGTAFGAHLAKYPGLFARLALTLHFMQPHQNQVGLGVAQAAAQLIDEYLEPHARKVYGALEAHPAQGGAIRIATWLREDQIKEFTERDIRRKNWAEFSRERDTEVIGGALALLEANGWIAIEERPATVRGGRPTKDYKTNPAAWA